MPREPEQGTWGRGTHALTAPIPRQVWPKAGEVAISVLVLLLFLLLCCRFGIQVLPHRMDSRVSVLENDNSEHREVGDVEGGANDAEVMKDEFEHVQQIRRENTACPQQACQRNGKCVRRGGVLSRSDLRWRGRGGRRGVWGTPGRGV
jgi:hypothetical protein